MPDYTAATLRPPFARLLLAAPRHTLTAEQVWHRLGAELTFSEQDLALTRANIPRWQHRVLNVVHQLRNDNRLMPNDPLARFTWTLTDPDGIAWARQTVADALPEAPAIAPIEYPDDLPVDAPLFEGAAKTVTVNAYERNPAARAACIAHYGAICQVCGFDFRQRYGPLGEGFIHVHHLRMLAEIGQAYRVDPVTDLRPVCPNCHAMLHRTTPPLTIEALRDLLR